MFFQKKNRGPKKSKKKISQKDFKISKLFFDLKNALKRFLGPLVKKIVFSTKKLPRYRIGIVVDLS